MDRPALAELLDIEIADLARTHRDWVEAALRDQRKSRQAYMSESVAVGRQAFVERMQDALSRRGKHRRIKQLGDQAKRQDEESKAQHAGGRHEPIVPAPCASALGAAQSK